MSNNVLARVGVVVYCKNPDLYNKEIAKLISVGQGITREMYNGQHGNHLGYTLRYPNIIFNLIIFNLRKIPKDKIKIVLGDEYAEIESNNSNYVIYIREHNNKDQAFASLMAIRSIIMP